MKSHSYAEYQKNDIYREIEREKLKEVMVQFEAARQDRGARYPDLWRPECEHLCFIESLLFFCCFSR
jgi:hypothetical protein